MPTIRIEIQDQSVLEAFNRLIQAGTDFEPVLGAIGRQVKTNVQLGFVSGRSPDGTPWAPLRVRQGQPLRDTNRLMNSIDYQVSGDAVEIGTNVLYAPTHQFGAVISARNAPWLTFPVPGGFARKQSVTIPQRPFFPDDGLPDAWRDDIVGIINDHLLQSWDAGA